MRSTSSRRSAVALLLCGPLLWGSAPPARAAGVTAAREPALLLKFAAPDLDDRTARRLLDPIPTVIADKLRVRWLPVPTEPSGGKPVPAELPVPDDAALRRIAGKVSGASERMDKVETTAASLLLDDAEAECRSYRFTEATRPFLAEIFLRRGILKLWEGRTSDAEALFSRVRALRPEFTPDPAIFPPQFLSGWKAALSHAVPEAELLVESLPSGALIFVDGERRGNTPSRIRTNNYAPIQIRVSHPGYKDAETTGQWLPGDTEILRFSLPGDRVARLGELLSVEGRAADGGAGPLVDEIAAAAGTARIAVLMLEKDRTGDGLRVRLYAGRPSGRNPAFLGEKTLPAGTEDAGIAGGWTADVLAADGWPKAERLERPWYNSAWFWAVVLSAGVAAALGAGGGGGSGGASGGTVAVDF